MQLLRRIRNRLIPPPPLKHDTYLGDRIIDGQGHREYVGELWDLIGPLQFNFMKQRGLKPEHILYDVACGSLRGGVHFIPYLNEANYCGLDIKQELIDAGIERELGLDLYKVKRPEFVVSELFEFSRFSKKPDYAIAVSLFTHLTEADILLCLRNLHTVAKSATTLYSSFFLAKSSQENPTHSHPHLAFNYTIDAMEEFGANTGWKPNYIGHWNHPRGQVMMEYNASLDQGPPCSAL